MVVLQEGGRRCVRVLWGFHARLRFVVRDGINKEDDKCFQAGKHEKYLRADSHADKYEEVETENKTVVVGDVR